MVDLFPGVFPLAPELLKRNLKLGRRILQGKNNIGLTRLAQYRYPSSRDLVPFVIALTIEGAYNAETALRLGRKGVEKYAIFGVESLKVEGEKNRKSSKRYRKDLDVDVAGPWIRLLEQLTEPLRSSLAQEDDDCLFIFSSGGLGGKARALGISNGSHSNDSSWTAGLDDFRKRHNLIHFSLGQLRPTVLNQVGINHGSVAAHQAAQHRSFQTTENHYIGAGTVAREQERLGETMNQLQRFVGTGGRVDVRRSARPPSHDKGAATPGFNCDDPLDSPIPGQKRFRLCRAYGECPVCPLASVVIDDPRAIAFWFALADAIYRSLETLDPQNWLEKWAPITSTLLGLIDQVSEEARNRAALFSITLPKVG